MNVDTIRDRLPEYARDLSLNLGSVLSARGSAGLSAKQIAGSALASALATRNEDLIAAIETASAEVLEDADVNAARTAAALMGMTNVYYRFLHLVDDPEYAKLPAGLRMNAMRDPGVPREDFELYSLAVSAVNGCGACVASHEKVLRKAGVSREAVQSTARIAAVVHAVAAVLPVKAKAA